MKIISINNQKGGVGKTTTSFELCSILSEEGAKVLAIDFDPQRGLSKYAQADRSKPTIWSVMTGEAKATEAVQKPGSFHIVPAERNLILAEKEFDPFPIKNRKLQPVNMTDAQVLKNIIDEIADDFDYVIIDNSPAPLTINYMSQYAADYLITVMDADIEAVEGLLEFIGFMNAFKVAAKTNIKHLGTLITKYSSTFNMSIEAYNTMVALKDNFGAKPFETTIRRTVTETEAKAYKQGINEYKKRNRGAAGAAEDYKDFVAEVKRRIRESEE